VERHRAGAGMAWCRRKHAPTAVCYRRLRLRGTSDGIEEGSRDESGER
jgi:hypothetical protein